MQFTQPLRYPTPRLEKKNSAAYVAFLVGALEAERGAFRLDVADAAARVALLGRDAALLRACGRLVARSTAVVAEPLLRRTVFSDVADCS